MPPRNPADRPATEPRTAASRLRLRIREWYDDGLLVYEDYAQADKDAEVLAEAAQGAAPHDLDCYGKTGLSTCRCSEGAAPRAEGLREALEHVLDVWPAPSPEEFARLHRVLTGHDSCSSRPSDERVPESEE